MMPILSKSVGGDRPQYPVAKSTRFWRRAVRSVLAMPAGDEARAAHNVMLTDAIDDVSAG